MPCRLFAVGSLDQIRASSPAFSRYFRMEARGRRRWKHLRFYSSGGWKWRGMGWKSVCLPDYRLVSSLSKCSQENSDTKENEQPAGGYSPTMLIGACPTASHLPASMNILLICPPWAGHLLLYTFYKPPVMAPGAPATAAYSLFCSTTLGGFRSWDDGWRVF
ncbi:hypothetical protein HPP92_029101 [Vanilla planifolia]|uniref:Uncharacterized protein n=1 Tax=Vanilla planifolia TaxID=51239 RepID=A0A835P5I9_VANPL|nr:hypothetical protein HPP92_029101 [Vanilla planifolia]KAG0445921.1 hypothetical protein HPP92_029090 [Vanilla planifolia]